ncbi:hypothetical protein DPMN_084812 [Dreissena polymorpha]|uniref:Uncharacterized protein n=1 Tax=Dreissena polymorpha TaxID=45954 RepID=A0A9D4BJR0_DREPO|nr:hypothetical protein DPMN_084812 [Dreissena polymorpha]
MTLASVFAKASSLTEAVTSSFTEAGGFVEGISPLFGRHRVDVANAENQKGNFPSSEPTHRLGNVLTVHCSTNPSANPGPPNQ